jgi:ribonuclease BN (tRNA processing enzyme)
MNTVNVTRPVSLKSDKLSLYFLGVGSAFALKNNQTNLLIVKGDKHVMVDFGMSGPRALSEVLGLKVTDIETVLPTHSHADHVGGFEGIALMNRYVGQRFMKKPKVQMIINEEYQRELWTHTLQGGLERNEECAKGQKMQFTDYFDVVRPQWQANSPREIYAVDHGDIHLEIFRTNHIPEQSSDWESSFISYGMLIDEQVFFSGDTKFDHTLIEMYEGRAKYFFHDVQFFPGAVHAPLADLKTIPGCVKQAMYLMHYSDDFEKQDISGFAGWARQGVGYVFDK